MTTRRMIVPPSMANIVDKYHYVPGVLVGDMLYVSGQVGRDANLQVVADPEAQFEQAFRNVGLVLEAAGASFADVIELETWFTRFPQDLPLFMQVKDRFITRDFPTWTGFGVAALSIPGLLVEIRVTALVPAP
ncbi:MAG: RidA family protein [Casimicrobiaceae bacterium]